MGELRGGSTQGATGAPAGSGPARSDSEASASATASAAEAPPSAEPCEEEPSPSVEPCEEEASGVCAFAAVQSCVAFCEGLSGLSALMMSAHGGRLANPSPSADVAARYRHRSFLDVIPLAVATATPRMTTPSTAARPSASHAEGQVVTRC